jgi:hypothetical protein
MEEEGGGMEPSGFPISGCPSAASPAPVTGGGRETRDQGYPGLGPPPARRTGRGAAREGAGSGSGSGAGASSDWKARWLLPLRAPLFCFVVLSS